MKVLSVGHKQLDTFFFGRGRGREIVTNEQFDVWSHKLNIVGPFIDYMLYERMNSQATKITNTHCSSQIVVGKNRIVAVVV